MRLPASLLEESKLQSGSLQHCEGCDGDWAARLAGKAALQPHLLPVRVDLADVHGIKVPAGRDGWQQRAYFEKKAPSLHVSRYAEPSVLLKHWANLSPFSFESIYILHEKLFNISIASETAAVHTPFTPLTPLASSFKGWGPPRHNPFQALNCSFVVSSILDDPDKEGKRSPTCFKSIFCN